jgi:hypothetical protein
MQPPLNQNFSVHFSMGCIPSLLFVGIATDMIVATAETHL